VLCVLGLRASPYPEPDDDAYRASIVAMTDGHFFTLSGAWSTDSDGMCPAADLQSRCGCSQIRQYSGATAS
jgi:hypothetical protein